VEAITSIQMTVQAIHEISSEVANATKRQEIFVREVALSMDTVSKSGEAITKGKQTIAVATEAACQVTQEIRQASQAYR